MRVGFTGTQRGMSSRQIHQLKGFLLSRYSDIEQFHHGCCVGADTQAAGEAEGYGIELVFHWPTDLSKATTDFRDWDGIHRKPKPYLERNHNIVLLTDVLIAAPKTPEEVLRSGTWATVRHARKLSRPIIFLDSQGLEPMRIERPELIP